MIRRNLGLQGSGQWSWQTSKSLAIVFSWILENTEKTMAHAEGFSTIIPRTVPWPPHSAPVLCRWLWNTLPQSNSRCPRWHAQSHCALIRLLQLAPETVLLILGCSSSSMIKPAPCPVAELHLTHYASEQASPAAASHKKCPLPGIIPSFAHCNTISNYDPVLWWSDLDALTQPLSTYFALLQPPVYFEKVYAYSNRKDIISCFLYGSNLIQISAEK